MQRQICGYWLPPAVHCQSASVALWLDFEIYCFSHPRNVELSPNFYSAGPRPICMVGMSSARVCAARERRHTHSYVRPIETQRILRYRSLVHLGNFSLHNNWDTADNLSVTIPSPPNGTFTLASRLPEWRFKQLGTPDSVRTSVTLGASPCPPDDSSSTAIGQHIQHSRPQ